MHSNLIRSIGNDGDVNEYVSREALEAREHFDFNRKVIFIKGMRNSHQVHAESCWALSLVQMCTVIGVYNKTDGFWGDVLQFAGDKNQFQGFSRSAESIIAARNSQSKVISHGYRSAATVAENELSRNQAQVGLFRVLRDPANRRWEIFAHSQGNLILQDTAGRSLADLAAAVSCLVMGLFAAVFLILRA